MLLLKRFGFRWVFVLVTAGVAVCLPFMTELMGLVGKLRGSRHSSSSGGSSRVEEGGAVAGLLKGAPCCWCVHAHVLTRCPTCPLYHHPTPTLCCPGALGYVPLCFVLPCVMWLKTQRGSLSLAQQAVNWLVIGISVLVGCLAAIGSLRSLIVSFSSYEFFS